MTLFAAILMGGKATRLGGVSKSDLVIGQTTCFERVVSCLQPFCDEIGLSAASPAQVAGKESGFSVIYDSPPLPDLDGVPNALLSIFQWGMSTRHDYIVTTTADTPFLPDRFVDILREHYESASEQSRPVVATSSGRTHGLHALWPRTCFPLAISLIKNENVRSVTKLHDRLGSLRHEFSHSEFQGTKIDPFFNINTPEDLEIAAQIAKLNGA